MDISIVTGTYNRLHSLQNMIASARLSVGRGLDLEFVIVDGGSKDGTQQWCMSQPDVQLIAQGQLLGAVKAFNEGAYSAQGDYVILANDDVTFMDESVLRSYVFMQENPTVGVGCFYQDRDGLDWHVSRMPVIIDNVQTNYWYGQVCIVPRWLGNLVGWWGNVGYYTYAGDNELSCNVLEAGYDVKPIPCACIHDGKLEDELRIINNTKQFKSTDQVHPDTQKFLAKWTRKNGLLGPQVKRPFIADRFTPRYPRILYAPIYEAGVTHDMQLKTKRGLREALQGYASVAELDWVSEPVDYVFDLADAFQPNIFLFQIHDVNKFFNLAKIKELRQLYPNAVFINWNGDCFPENFFNREYMDMMKLMDLTGFVQVMCAERYDAEDIPWFYWQIGFEPVDAKDIDPTVPAHDVVFLGNGHYPYRQALGRFLVSLRKDGIDIGLYGSWPKDVKTSGYNLYNVAAGRSIYKRAKIAISDNRPGATGFLSNRIYEAMAGGAMILQQRVAQMTELTGFQDHVHLAVWDTYEELEDLIKYFLISERERKAVAARGQDYVLKNCNFNARVKELFDELARRNIYHYSGVLQDS